MVACFIQIFGHQFNKGDALIKLNISIMQHVPNIFQSVQVPKVHQILRTITFVQCGQNNKNPVVNSVA